MSIALVFDLVIAGLLVATIVYAALLNRKLSALREAKAEMEAAVGAFAQAAGKAEGTLESLRAASEHGLLDASRSAQETRTALEGRIQDARALADELGFLAETAGKLADRMDGAIATHRGQGAGPTATPGVAGDREISDGADPALGFPDPGFSGAEAKAARDIVSRLRRGPDAAAARARSAAPATPGSAVRNRAGGLPADNPLAEALKGMR